jgi:F-type H+-transporting ATPase subunit delta
MAGTGRNMAKNANPRRYAQAVFEIALGKNELDRWQADLQKIIGAANVADFLDVLDSPRIEFKNKARLLKESLGDINPLALNLMLLLIERSEVKLITEIAAMYGSLMDKYHGVETAEVVTAVTLNDEEKEALAAKLGAVVDAKVELKTEVEPGILGGIIARVGGKLLDGSTRSKLVALKKDLVGRG